MVPYYSDIIYNMTYGPDGLIWMETRNGMQFFNPKTKQIVSFKTRHTNFFESQDFNVTRIIVDDKNEIWIGTRQDGLFRYIPKTDSLVSYKHRMNDSTSISGNMVRSIIQVQSGDLYIGTKSNGLNLFDRANDCFIHVLKNQLGGESIYHIEEDDQANLWIGTHNVIIKYNPKNEIEKFNIEYGLQGKVFEINASLQLKDGTILMGGQNGLNLFRPETVKKWYYQAPMIINKIRVYDKVIDYDITETKTIILNRKDNFLSFEFSLLDYSDANKNQYAYQLTGVDSDWTFCQNRNFVSYTHLPPGSYTFQVKGANMDEIWNEKGVSIQIVIPEPLWMRKWFQLLTLFIVIC